MRVLIQPFEPFYEPSGGSYVQITRTVERLRELGVTAEVSTEPAPDLAAFDLVHIFHFPDSLDPLHYLFNARRQNKPIVLSPIYANSNPERFRLAMAEVFAQGPAPALTEDARRLLDLGAKILQLERAMFVAAADLIFTLSEREGEALHRDFGAPFDRIRVIHNGVEPFFAGAKPDEFIQQYELRDFILYVGRISPEKNTLNLVSAWHDETVPLVLIGKEIDRVYAEMCRQAAGTSTVFIPHMAQSQVASAYAAAKVYALVSWFEGMPLAAMEAGLAGCNIVLTTETGGPEFFGDLVRYCDPGDMTGIRSAIQAAYQAPRSDQLSLHIRNKFTWENTARQTANAYLEAIEFHHARVSLSPDYATRLEDMVFTQVGENARLTDLYRSLEGWAHDLEQNLIRKDREREQLAQWWAGRLLQRLQAFIPSLKLFQVNSRRQSDKQ